MAYNTKIQLNLYKYENNAFKRIAVIDDYNEISFSRKMYEAGEFTITINQNIPNAKLFEIGTFVQFGSDKYDIGEISNITTPIGAEGKGSQNLVITGYDLRYLFKRRVIKNCNANGKWEMTAKGEIVMRSLIQDQCGINAEVKRRLPIGNVIPNSAAAIGKEFSISESFSNLYDVLVTIATQSEIGWCIRFESGTMTLEFYEGEDLSASVFFSTEFDSLQDGEFNETTDAYSNTVYIGGKGQGDQRDIYEGEDGNPEGMNRFESWDDQSSLTNEIEYTNEALSMLAQYGDLTTVAGTALAKNPYVYKENYNVGDIIKISFSGKSARTRVLSVTEHWSGRGQYAIDFEFGKPMNNLAGQLQLMLRQIQRAGDNSSSTDSVRWYTIPTDTEMPKADVTFNTIGFIGDCGNDGKTFKLYFDENGTGSKSYHVWFKQLAGTGKLTLTTGVEGKQNLEMDSGTYVGIIYVDQQGNVLNQASAVSVNSGGQSAGTASTITVNGKTYDVGGGGGSGIPLGGWTSFENDTTPNDEWLQAGTTFDSDTYPELFLYLGGNTVPERYDHSRPGDYEPILLPSTSATAITAPYDGEIIYTTNANVSTKIYINNTLITQPNVRTTYGRTTATFSVKKGDKFYVTVTNGIINVDLEKVRWFTHPMFIKTTTTASSYTPSSAVQEIKDYTKDYVDAKNSYSTTETLTGGTWVDGKPIYRKTYSGTLSSTLGSNTSTIIPLANLPSISTLVEMKGFVEQLNNPHRVQTLNDLYSRFYLDFSAGIRGQSNISIPAGSPYAITIEYTKTTD